MSFRKSLLAAVSLFLCCTLCVAIAPAQARANQTTLVAAAPLGQDKALSALETAEEPTATPDPMEEPTPAIEPEPEPTPSIANAAVKLDATNYAYVFNGKVMPTISVSLDGAKLVEDKDYKVSLSGNDEAGTAHATVIGINGYIGEKTVDFTITPLKVSKGDLSIAGTEFTYTGKAVKPKVYLGKWPAQKHSGAFGCSVTYKNNKKVGLGSVTVKFTGSCVGEVTKTFKIVPKKSAIASAASPSYSTVKATASKKRGGTGYQFAISTGKSVGSAFEKIYSKKATCTFSGLERATKYRVWVRPFGKIGGKTVYGAWSKAKAVKTRQHPFVGTWDLVEMRQGSQVTGEAELNALKQLKLYVFLKLNANGSSSLSMFGENTDGVWQPKTEATGVITMENQDVSMRYSKGLLALSQDGASLVFRQR
ncbi:MAG: hypothetical protein IJ087_21725 [Eggerthellaceae bacterium]|nr:hypothetical protein [Eggerthellaceae bacterium]